MPAYALQPTAEQVEWFAAQFDALPVAHKVIRPSVWAESKRYLPPSTTSLPGPYRFDVAPYLREILDCLSIDSPVREVAIMKGVQLGLTVGVLENAIGYFIEHVKTAPCMLVTADAELAKLRLDSYIIPMLQHSQLKHLISSADETNTRKTGSTAKKIEWVGGGFLVPFGAQNANKLRSISIQMMLRDEIDGWPDIVGKDGDPIKLSTDRTAGYEPSRKILDISTPLLKGTSKIAKRYAMGDQRKYFVRCLRCEFAQVLRWRHIDEGGVISGIVWETEHEQVIPESVGYLCQQCQHRHTNDDKTKLLSADYGAEWQPTARSYSPTMRSYHISALYSPVGMQSWLTCVEKWREAWDDANNRPKNITYLQTVYNNVFGEPFEVRGVKVEFEIVSAHRRSWYSYGDIPNRQCELFCGGPVLMLVCTVDVHADNLAVSVWGWCRDRRVLLIDYARFEGDTELITNPETWGRLARLIEDPEPYTADDGRVYSISATMIDSGYRADVVYQFCANYEIGVYPVKGRDIPAKNQRDREYSDFTTPSGQRAFGIVVDFYKERWSIALRHSDWDGVEIQPPGHFNAPKDATDKQLKELTVETKVAKIDPRSKERIGWEWHRPSGAPNELWDLLIYSNAALDIIAWDVCRVQWELETVNWPAFWDHLAKNLPPPSPQK